MTGQARDVVCRRAAALIRDRHGANPHPVGPSVLAILESTADVFAAGPHVPLLPGALRSHVLDLAMVIIDQSETPPVSAPRPSAGENDHEA